MWPACLSRHAVTKCTIVPVMGPTLPLSQAYMATSTAYGVDTECVRHRDLHPGALQGLSTPIVTATTYKLPDAATGARLSVAPEASESGADGFFYSRWASPTVEVAGRAVSALESAAGTIVFSSGMAAITSTLVAMLRAGDHVVMPSALYGGTFEWMQEFGEPLGIAATFVDGNDPDAFAAAVTPATRLLYTEAMSNPTVRVTDLHAVGAVGQRHGIPVVVDATFATPYHLTALPSVPGVEVVIHAATKYLSGHSDLLAGTVSSNNTALLSRVGKALKLFGGVLSAHDAYSVIRGMKTLAVRMERHNRNAAAVADFLASHRSVVATHYPGLASHPDHDVATRLLRNGYGGMVAFEVAGGAAGGQRVVEALQLVSMAVSLGSVESLAEHPASMTHAMLPASALADAGIAPGLIRLSVGLEAADDIIRDLGVALEYA